MSRMAEPDKATVKEAIQAAFPHDWEWILRDMRWLAFDGNWAVDYKGIYVGIEPDGYIHS